MAVEQRSGGAPAASFAMSGWLLPALATLLGASGWVFGVAWAHAGPRTAPPVPLMAAVSLVVGVMAFTQAAAVALNPARPPAWWRPAIVGLVAAGTVGLVLAAAERGALGFLPAFAVCALAARAGETVGAHLGSAVRLPEEYGGGDWSRQVPETRRVVLETWVLAAAATALAGRGGGQTVALVALVGSGLALAVGSHVHALQRLCAGDGFTWARADAASVWRSAAGAAAVVLLVAALVPGVPPLIPRVLPAAVKLLLHTLFHRAAPTRVRPLAHVHTTTILPPGGVPLPGLPALGGGGSGPGFGALDIFGQEWLIALIGVGVLGVAVWSYLRYGATGGDARGALRRLWAAILALFGFWRWLGAFGGGRSLAAAPGGGATAAAAGAGPASAAGLGWRGDPRRLIRAAYRRFLREAAAAGHARGPGQTPARYETAVSGELGDSAAAGEAALLTRAYEEARYSRHAIKDERLPPVRAAVERLLQALHHVRGLSRGR